MSTLSPLGPGLGQAWNGQVDGNPNSHGYEQDLNG